MAQASNVRKYQINGVDIPVYPSNVNTANELISRSWNDMNGVFRDKLINSKLKVIWKYDLITREQLESLYGDMIYTPIQNSGSRIFTINTYIMGVGFVSGSFYLGAETKFDSVGSVTKNGAPNLLKGEIHWIEVDGNILNN